MVELALIPEITALGFVVVVVVVAVSGSGSDDSRLDLILSSDSDLSAGSEPAILFLFLVSGAIPSAKCTACLPIGFNPPLFSMRVQAPRFVPWTTSVGKSESVGRIGESNFSGEMVMEWPWFARIRY